MHESDTREKRTMLNAKQTSQAGAAVAPEGNGSGPRESAGSRSTPASASFVGNISTRPGHEAIRRLPPGPRAPALMQSLAIWYRRNVFFERCRARYGKRFTIRLLGALR